MANLLTAQYLKQLKGYGISVQEYKHAAKELSDVTHCLQVANIAEAAISGAFWLQKPPCATRHIAFTTLDVLYPTNTK